MIASPCIKAFPIVKRVYKFSYGSRKIFDKILDYFTLTVSFKRLLLLSETF